MELLVNLNSLDFLYDFKQMNVSNYVVGTKYFSCRSSLELDYNDLESLQKDNLNIFVLVNALVEQKYLDDLKNHLDKLHRIGIKKILFHDFAVLMLNKVNNYGFELYYWPETLNTNSDTLNFLATQGMTGAFLAREISLDKKEEIAKNAYFKTIIQGHGVEYMSYSKRMLLSSYKEASGLDFSTNLEANITVQAANQKQKSHIYEDKFGTHILTKEQIYTLDLLSSLKAFDYLYIESLFIDKFKLLEIVDLYNNGLKAIEDNTYGRDYRQLVNTLFLGNQDIIYHHSFLFDETLYKIEDVRKRDNNERN